MPLIQPRATPPLKLRLARDLVRTLKRGHPWVFADALRQRPVASAGQPAILLDNKKGREVAHGFYDPDSPLAFRACTLTPGQTPDEVWAHAQLSRAWSLRQTLFDDQTTGFRLFNGEGDGLPGLICDVYDDTAVLQLDGPGPQGFWHAPGIAEWVAERLSLGCVYYREQAREGGQGRALIGKVPTAPIFFQEHGVTFTADIVHGQKTGFFLDQRENRRRMMGLTTERRVLNGFGYTGGFSVYAGLGGAREVTTVDLAGPALALADHHWQLNHLPPENHQSVKADAFNFFEATARKGQQWEVVIVDPPSFASSKGEVSRAVSAYQKLIAGGSTVTTPDGLLAVASCSSQVDLDTFLAACEIGVSKAKRRATILAVHGQPPDHPTPLAFPEFRYLKFVLMRIE